MGSIGNSKSSNSLQIYNERNADQYKTLYSLPSNLEESNEIARFNFRIGQYQGLPAVAPEDTQIKNIDLSTLSNNQETVNKSKIDSLLKLGMSGIQKIEDKDNIMEMPYVIQYGSTNLIMDGHHRLTAMKALGAKSAKVRVLNLAEFVKKRRKK